MRKTTTFNVKLPFSLLFWILFITLAIPVFLCGVKWELIRADKITYYRWFWKVKK